MAQRHPSGHQAISMHLPIALDVLLPLFLDGPDGSIWVATGKQMLYVRALS